MSTSNTYNINGRRLTTRGISASLSDKYYWNYPWDDEDSFAGSLKYIKWKFDPYREFVEVRNEKAPKLPDNYPKGDLDNLLGFGSEDG